MSPAVFQYVASNSILWVAVIACPLLASRFFDKRGLLFCGIALAVLLCAGRWPMLRYPAELNVDESQMLAQALKFRTAPVPWLHVDGTTSGPLNSYWLLPPALAGIPLGYVSARVMGLAAIWIFLWFHLLTARGYLGTRNAFILLLPFVAFFAFTRFWDFAHYSSEHLPMALLAGEIYLAANILTPEAFGRKPDGLTRARGMVACLAGAIPFAKLQAAPVAAAVLGVAMSFDVMSWYRRTQGRFDHRRAIRWLFPYVAGLVLPAVVILGAVTIAGAFHDFWISYIVFGLTYNKGAQNRVEVLWNLVTSNDLFVALASAIVGLAMAFVAIGLLRRFGRPSPSLRSPVEAPVIVAGTRRHSGPSQFPSRCWVLAAAFLATTTLVVLRAGQPFPHYLLLFVGPLWLLAVASASGLDEHVRSRTIVSGALVCVAVVLVPASLRQGPLQYWLNMPPLYLRATPGELARAVLPMARPGDSMAVWGWEPSLYVQTGLPPATRDAVTYGVMFAGPYQTYYLNRFAADMQAARPRFFVDAVRPGALEFADRQIHGHENFAPVAGIIERNYRLAGEVGKPGAGYRLYLLKESTAVVR